MIWCHMPVVPPTGESRVYFTNKFYLFDIPDITRVQAMSFITFTCLSQIDICFKNSLYIKEEDRFYDISFLKAAKSPQ